MNKKVKKVLKISGFSLLGIFILLLILPFLFTGKILNIVKSEANKQLNAQVDFQDVSLSLIRNFPHISFSIDQLSVVGKGEFEKDTLASVKRVHLVFNLMSIFGDDGYEIRKVLIDHPCINLITLADGKTNMDIMSSSVEEEEDADEPDTTGSALKLSLQEFRIKNAHLSYRNDSSRVKAQIENLNFTLSGNMNKEITTLKIRSTIDSITFSESGVAFLNKAHLRFQSDLAADLAQMKFDLKKTELQLNAILFQMEGSVAMPDTSSMDMDIALSSPKTQFKEFLSLIPALYAKDFEKIETKGNLAFSAFAKGRLQGDNYPAFGLDLKINDAMFRYPDLPKTVDHINIEVNVSNKGGSLDNTVVDIPRFHFEMAQNPFDLSLLLKTPISDLNINLKAKGSVNLNMVKEVYPLDDQTLSGMINLDMALQGRLSSIEKERYEEFQANGFVQLENLKYTSKDFPEAINISKARLEFSSQFLDLKQLNIAFGKSDLYAAGKIENYLHYVFKNQPLYGKLETRSNYLDLQDIMSNESAAETTTASSALAAPAEPMTIIEVPSNINLSLSTAFNKIIYDNIAIDHLKGNMEVKDQVLSLKNISLQTLGASVGLSGYYSTAQINNPTVDLNLDIKELDIQQAFKTFNTIQKLMPVAEHTYGKVSVKMQMNALLDQTLSPVLSSMQAKGNLQTSHIRIEGLSTLNQIAEATKLEKLKKLSLDKIHVGFEIINGNVEVKPFDIKMGNTHANVSGLMGLDQSIKYVVKMTTPRSELGSHADEFVGSLTGKTGVKAPEAIKFDVLVGGTVTKPTVKVSASGMADDLKEEVKRVIEEKIDEAKTIVNEQLEKAIAEAEKQKEKLINEAQKQADAVRQQAEKSVNQLVEETNKQIKKLEDQAKNPLAKKAAQEAGNKLKKETQVSADNLISKANKQADELINQAQKQGDKLIDQARQQKIK